MDETDKMRKDVEKHNSLVSKNAFELASDPREVFVKPAVKEEIPYLDFSTVQNSLAKLARDIEAFESVSVEALPAPKQEVLNKAMLVTEQVLTDMSGLPRRPWFRHQLYAPGFYTGYGVKTLPGIREAVEQKDWKEAQEQIQKLSKTFELMDAHILKLQALSK